MNLEEYLQKVVDFNYEKSAIDSKIAKVDQEFKEWLTGFKRWKEFMGVLFYRSSEIDPKGLYDDLCSALEVKHPHISIKPAYDDTVYAIDIDFDVDDLDDSWDWNSHFEAFCTVEDLEKVEEVSMEWYNICTGLVETEIKRLEDSLGFHEKAVRELQERIKALKTL